MSTHPLERASQLVTMLGESALKRDLDAGDYAHLEGDYAETVSLMLDGQMIFEAYPVSSYVPCAVGIAGPGHLIGEEALGSNDGLRASSVRALTKVRLVVIYRDELLDVITAKDNARRLFFSMVAERVQLADRGAIASSASTVEVRVARWLLHMHKVFARKDLEAPAIAATQENLAGLAGTRRPTANRVLRTLCDEGFIELGRGRASVLDEPGLLRWLEARDAG